MSDNKHAGRGGKGYYIALILCAAAIGITSYVYYRNANRVEEVSIQESVGEDILVGTMEAEDVPALATQPQTQSTTPATQGTTPAPTTKKPFRTTSPVSGEEISAYSMEALSYNETTRDWRVHNGVDIAADAGTEVCAAADGEVYTVYEDDSMGYTVVIRHDGGYLTRYASLSQDIPVKSGDTVSAGQVIGYVGDTALVETTLGSHIHFSVTHQDEPMNPADFLALGEYHPSSSLKQTSRRITGGSTLFMGNLVLRSERNQRSINISDKIHKKAYNNQAANPYRVGYDFALCQFI